MRNKSAIRVIEENGKYCLAILFVILYSVSVYAGDNCKVKDDNIGVGDNNSNLIRPYKELVTNGLLICIDKIIAKGEFPIKSNNCNCEYRYNIALNIDRNGKIDNLDIKGGLKEQCKEFDETYKENLYKCILEIGNTIPPPPEKELSADGKARIELGIGCAIKEDYGPKIIP